MYYPTSPILQTSCVKFVCSADSNHCTTHYKVALVLQMPYLLSSFFSFLSLCLPLISGEYSIVILSLLVIWFSCYFTMMTNLVIPFLYHRCVTTVLYVYDLHGTVVSVHTVYSTVCTMVGVSLLYCVHVLLQYTPHGTVVSVHPVYSTRVLFLPSCWCVTRASFACTPVHAARYDNFGASDYLYRIMCMYTLHAAAMVVSLHLL
jgi:hypothetical protein